MNGAYERLFPTPSGFDESEYLAFLSRRAPQDLSEQLTHDAHPELMLDDHVEVADLTRPLSSRSFLADSGSPSTPILRLAGILEYTLSGYALAIRENAHRTDPYKQIYIASFYLHCCLQGPVRSREYVSALLVLVEAAADVALEGQLQVSRFIASLIPKVPKASVADPTPLSTALIALSLIAVNTVGDLSLLTERAMHDEHFTEAWTKEEEECEEGDPSLDAMKALRRAGSAFFAVSGKVEQIAERFRKAQDWK